MYWTLLVLVGTGTFSPDFKHIQIPMLDKEACVKAGEAFNENSKGLSILCIGSYRGEIVKIK